MTSSSLGPRAVLIDDQILVSGYEWRGQLKALGGRWFKARKAWAFDASPAVAALLVETFGEALRATDSVQNLVMAAEAAEQGRDAASEALGATRLDPVPITKGAPHWEHQLRAYHFAYPLAGAMLAIGQWISSLTKNQIIAFLISLLILFALMMMGQPYVLSSTKGLVADIFRTASTATHFESMARGVIDVRDGVYFGSLITLFLFLNIYTLQNRHWK